MNSARPRGEGDNRLTWNPVRPSRVVPDLAQDVTRGLLRGRPRWLPPKYFYDARGSALFDRICDTPEYYPTRTEDALLAQCASQVVGQTRPDVILELGAGTARKTRRLFDACDQTGMTCVFAPFDVCGEVMLESGENLLRDYPWLSIDALVGDYHAGLDHLPGFPGRRLFLFLGSTIGNFAHGDGVAFLRELAGHMRHEDRLLIGMDRVKDPTTLHAAYNDAEGVTAAFNLNLLTVLNRELEADFEPDHYYHHATYDPDRQRIEMYLVAKQDQHVNLNALNAPLKVREGEAILTEISRKFTHDGVGNLLVEAGLELEAHFEAPEGYFSLALARPRAP